MVGFAFIFVAVILLLPILIIVLVLDFIAIWFNPGSRVRRGFEVLPIPEAPKKP
jgi:ABC-type microcin C transport system permease subunit YejB